ncbi:hypothetical protein M440DRAFT_1339497 [Trichoderma longibrachiatum ATCC 18648]|uniref:BZIP domain-containing protein n=1 Tax=Trichoderma longibrachiatum ATCC 18648 TaxID=983965 RepID=A0A2T4BVR3_TRILO|nr:hypothetical protein M440DRAFT_1339497 [Trichoderma longibrachiatum ATCC 18648]
MFAHNQRTTMVDAVDEWRGTANPDLRRRVQNRLNQRAYRQRRRRMLGVPEKTSSRAVDERISPAQCLVQDEAPCPTEARTTTAPWYTDPASVAAQFRALKLGRHAKPSPSSDHLLCIMQFNIMRAFGTITSILGLSPTDLLEDDTLSPFSPSLARETSARHLHHIPIPESLSPTGLQKSTPHHPWIDILPFPQMRDNLLRLEAGSSTAVRKHQYDADSICHWMVGLDASQKESGLILWGEPWDVAAWEVTADFLREWGWTLDGCFELFRSTNHWRKKRGLRPLFTVEERRSEL